MKFYSTLRISFLYVILSAVLVLAGSCAQTTASRGTSFIDPDWNGRPYRALVVEAADVNLDERAAIERAAVAELRMAGVDARAGIDLFLPTRDYGPAQREKLLRESGAEALLYITPLFKEIDRTYSPPERYGGFGYGLDVGHRHEHTGFGVGVGSGLLLEEPVAGYRASIISPQRKIWTGDFRTKGPTGMSFTAVGGRFARYLVIKLREDGII